VAQASACARFDGNTFARGTLERGEGCANTVQYHGTPMPKLRRREFVKSLAAAGAALALPAPRSALAPVAPTAYSADVVVLGAGVFGAWTALALQRAGRKVLLIDQYGPANSRSSSGGETRIIRMGYGAKEFYSRWAWQSLAEWKKLADLTAQPLFRPTGVLWLGKSTDDYLAQTAATLSRLSVPYECFSVSNYFGRFPRIAMETGMVGLLEVPAGALMARRAVQAVAAQAAVEGARFLVGQAVAPVGRGRIEKIAVDRDVVRAETFIFACGPWLPRIFPELLRDKIVPSRGEEFFFGTPAGDPDFSEGRFPTWIDLTADTFGTPDIEGRGFKVGIDLHGPAFDPDHDSRTLDENSFRFARDYAARRFPGLKDAPLVEHRVCQYENTSNEDFLIDRHPDHENVWLVGGGSGHGFKHGPALGSYVSKKIIEGGPVEPIFTLANKSPVKSPSIFNR